jgi:hypothetical protein
MDSSMYDFSIYCYEVSREGFFRDFKENVSDSDNIYSSVVMDFFAQRNVFIDELKSVIKLLDCSEKFFTHCTTDNTDYYKSYIDEENEMYNLDISHSNSVMDYESNLQMTISTALLKVITREPILIHYFLYGSLERLNFKLFEIIY